MSVSTKLLGLGGPKRQDKKSLNRDNSERERTGPYGYREVSDSEQLGDGKGRRRRRREKIKGERRRKNGQLRTAREVLQLNFWYFTSTISYILRKAKAFYNECCCDAYEDDKMRKVEVALIDPYFSMPVLPYTTMANCM